MIKLIKNSKRLNKSSIFYDEAGFSTLSVVVSLLLTLTLIFSSASVYATTSESANIQNIADTSSQAAISQVGEFMILVKACDALILSLGLSACVCGSVGVVCLCIPPTAAAGESLLDAAFKILNEQEKFSNNSANALNKIQKSLPFISTVKAYMVASANNGGAFNANYMAITILEPGEGIEIKPGNFDNIKNVLNDVNNGKEDLKRDASEAERLAQEFINSKREAWTADNINNPSSQLDRASRLANLSDIENPEYKSVDIWNFGYGLLRARKYFYKRKLIDTPTGTGDEKYADWVLRQHYYNFVINLLNEGYYFENSDSVDMNFPHIPRSTVEMQNSKLFTDVYFPITKSGDKLVMHAWDGCSNCNEVVGTGNAQSWNSNDYAICDKCHFSQNDFGSIGSGATSSVYGFEHYYKIIEEQSKIYSDAINKAAPYNKKVKDTASNWLSKFKELINSLSSNRIYACPPGAYGVFVICVNNSVSPANTSFNSSFVNTDATLGIRAAMSAATLIEENSNEGSTFITTFTDGIKDKIPAMSSFNGVALNIWSSLLTTYNNGSSSLIDGLESGLNSLSFNSSSELGTWAAKFIRNLFNSIGLEPVNLKPLKPVLINSDYVATKSKNFNTQTQAGAVSKAFSVKYLTLSQSVLKSDSQTNNILNSLTNQDELSKLLKLDSVDLNSGKIEIAKISPLGSWGPSIPITVTLPSCATSLISNVVSNVAWGIQSILGAVSKLKVWR